jgi:hypothetical protein
MPPIGMCSGLVRIENYEWRGEVFLYHTLTDPSDMSQPLHRNQKNADFLEWAKALGAEASKVEIRSTDENNPGMTMRGLFSTATIYPGERILMIPAVLSISAERLRENGTITRAVLNEYDWERRICAILEEVRQFAEISRDDGQQLRPDDILALYLIACQFLLHHREQLISCSSAANGNSTSSVATSSSSAPNVTQDTEPIIATVKTVLENDISSISYLPYVSMLPSSFPTHTLYYSDDELARIEGTNCHGFTVRMLHQIREDFLNLQNILEQYYQQQNCNVLDSHSSTDFCCCKTLRLDDIVTLETYKWALCNIYSRCTDFHVPNPNDPAQMIHKRLMIPIFDMINHQLDSPINHSLDDDGNLSVFYGTTEDVDLEPLQPGQEICFSYGPFPNEKLLLVYGFCIPNNPHDAMSIFAPMSPNDPWFNEKSQLLKSVCGIEDTNAPHSLKLESDRVIPDSLLSVLRVIGIQSLEDIVALSHTNSTQKYIDVISVTNEQFALTALRDAIYSMSRQLALNMISDDNLNGAEASKKIAANNNQSVADVIALRHEVLQQSLDGTGKNKPSSDSKSASEINVENALTLCHAEYSILQAALAEIDEKLDRLL